uniref:Mitochondrial carrier protein n=1 Tax=Peronospora matthiolae TaxID=2874970 RepID=A0AAV1T6E4_9STRA
MALSKPKEMVAAATAAGVGGFLATSILYPLDTLKTRIQSGSSLFPENDDDDDDVEGDASAPKRKTKTIVALITSLYRGIQYKAVESSTSKFLYFYTYTMLAQLVSPPNGKPVGPFTDLSIGYLSELCHLPITMPMELVGTRMQTGGSEKGNMIQILCATIKESGIGGLYKGLGAYFVLCLQPAIQYTVFERLKVLYVRKFKQTAQTLGALEAFVMGAIARSFATLVLFPYIRAKVLMQTEKRGPDGAGDVKQEHGRGVRAREETVASTLQRVYKEEGPLALYRGLGPELTRGALSSALMLMLKEKIQMHIVMLMMAANAA